MRSKLLVSVLAGAAVASAQRPVLFGVVYSCSSGRTLLKVESCAGTADSDACVIQYLDSSQQPGARISAARGQVTQMLASCVVQRPPEKKQSAPPAPAAPAAQSAPAPAQRPQNAPAPAPRPAQSRPTAPAPQQASFGIKVGESVRASTGLGWVSARVLAIQGADFQVRLDGSDIVVTKRYPAELRRSGPSTAEDRANGVYESGDRVQVRYEGQWVESRVVDGMGMEYKVTLPGNREAWARPDQMRWMGPSAVAAARKTKGVPCGAKLEGRWGSTTGIGGATIEFRSGKAKIAAPFTDPDTLDCVVSGDKIVLSKPGDPDEVVLQMNDDATIDAGLFGDLRRKGK
jgi:sRNA-binding protein